MRSEFGHGLCTGVIGAWTFSWIACWLSGSLHHQEWKRGQPSELDQRLVSCAEELQRSEEKLVATQRELDACSSEQKVDTKHREALALMEHLRTQDHEEWLSETGLHEAISLRRLSMGSNATETPCECPPTIEWLSPVAEPWRIVEGEHRACKYTYFPPTIVNEACITTQVGSAFYTDLATCVVEFHPNISTGQHPPLAAFVTTHSWSGLRGEDYLTIQSAASAATYRFWGAPPQDFIPDGSTSVMWSTDAPDWYVRGDGWTLCLRSSCDSFACPSGWAQKAGTVPCASYTCNPTSDLETCCEPLCPAPNLTALGDQYRLPDSCIAGQEYTASSQSCAASCSDGYDLSGWGPFQSCSADAGEFVLPLCEEQGEPSIAWVPSAAQPHPPCFQYAPGCIASHNFSEGVPQFPNYCTTLGLPVGEELVRLWFTHLVMNEQSHVLINDGEVDEVDEFKFAWIYRQYYLQTGEWFLGQDRIGPFHIGRAAQIQSSFSGTLGTADVNEQQGWILCAQSSCLTMTCPEGWTFNCSADGEWCDGSACESVADVERCCSQLGTGGLSYGTRNSSHCQVVTTTTTTSTTRTHGYQSADWTGTFVIRTVLTTTESSLQESLKEGVTALANVSYEGDHFSYNDRVYILLGSDSGDRLRLVGFHVLETEVDMASISMALALEVINSIDGFVIEDIQLQAALKRPAEEREIYDGTHYYGGLCQDLHPCESEELCWRAGAGSEWETGRSCALLQEERWCYENQAIQGVYWNPAVNPFITFQGWKQATGFEYDFEAWLMNYSYDYEWQTPQRAHEVCCTCGGGECPPGSMILVPGTANFCAPCPQGFFSNITGAVSCHACEKGQFSNATARDTGCDLCPIGRYAATTASTECLPCEEGHEATEEGSSECTPCEPGSWNDGTLDACAACPLGWNQQDEGATACSECGPGSYAGSLGQAECNECDPGWFGSGSALSACEPCPEGEQANYEGAVICDRCDIGRASGTNGTALCPACEPGQYSPVDGLTSCQLCEQGRFAGDSLSSECLVCDEGRYAELVASSGCTGCNESHLGQEQSWTTMQTAGNFTDKHGLVIWTMLRGAVSPESCVCAPNWQPALGSDFCERCREGVICHGADVIEILSGYASDGEGSVWDCSLGVKKACPGGKPGVCAPGRNPRSVACGACYHGMVAKEDGGCAECTRTDSAIPYFALGIAAVLAIIAYVIFDHPHKERAKLSLVFIASCVGQLITLLQQIGVISLVRVQFVGPMEDLFDILKKVTFFDIDILRPACLVDLDAETSYTWRVCAVFLGLCLILLAHSISQVLQHRHDWRTRWSTLACAVGTLLMTFIVSILSTMLAPFQCNWHPNGRSTVSWYPSVICWEGGEHERMIYTGCVACIMPLTFFALTTYAVWQFPRKLLKAHTRFLSAWAFLFARYTTRAYWYGPLVLVRNALVCVAPVFEASAHQVFFMQVILLFSLVVVLRVLPWRVQAANNLDALGHTCALLLIMVAGLFVSEHNSHDIAVVGVIFVAIIPAAVLVGLVYGVMWFMKSRRRPFQFFLCHHKLGAGCFCRLLKMRLLLRRAVTRKVFIDSDDLKNLDGLFDIVAHETETLAVICSQSVLTRPWCVGEITTAHVHHVTTIPVFVAGVTPAPQEFIDDFFDKVDISSLTRYGIDLPMIQVALTSLGKASAIYFPQEIQDGALNGCCAHLTGDKPAQDIELKNIATTLGEDRQPGVVIISDKTDIESASTAYILRDLINPSLLENHNSGVSTVLSLNDTVPSSCQTCLLICTNGLFTSHVLLALVDGLDRHTSMFPVMCTTNFTFPSEAWMEEQSSFQELPTAEREKATFVVKAVFTEIAVDFQPSALSGSMANLELKAKEIVSRVHGTQSISSKVQQLLGKTDKSSGDHSIGATRLGQRGTSSGSGLAMPLITRFLSPASGGPVPGAPKTSEGLVSEGAEAMPDQTETPDAPALLHCIEETGTPVEHELSEHSFEVHDAYTAEEQLHMEFATGDWDFAAV